MKKIVVSPQISNSEKKVPMGCLQDYPERRYKVSEDQKYYERRISSQKKPIDFHLFEKYREQQLSKKPMGMPRT
jgi:hypothetical protein